ncbi:hypothetical protein Q5O24_01160 [Eubacteriaceae bacterium ES3]|nr:hypothetical protein Q5O24_01160 [Eubacteriaceae bacterium ES3]
MRKKNSALTIILMIFMAVTISIVMELYFMILENKIPTDGILTPGVLASFVSSADWLRVLCILSIFMIIIICGKIYSLKKMGQRLYQFRYPLAGCVFLILVALEIHGSSIQCWSNYFQGSTVVSETIIGIPRLIRSDEWAVYTPMIFSQYLNGSGVFPYFSETIRGALTDAFIIYGQPVLDPAVIFRPFHWGYLFLSQAKGLSFFWMGRLIALFMVSFEYGMLFTKKNKTLAVTYAVLITWAPIVQWWFAINGLVEMLVFGQLALLMIALYMKTNNYYWRSFYALVILVCAGGYVLTFYPSWQVPLAYVFLVLCAGIVHENWKQFQWGKRDFIILLMVLVFLGLGMGYVLTKSLDTITTIFGTAYPGQRFETGGGEGHRFFLYPGTLFFGISSKILPYLNTCEWSVFFDFFPMGIILSFWVLFKERKRDFTLIMMLLTTVILTLWCTFEWPDWLAKITLLSYTQAIRTFLAVGYLNILILIRTLSLVEQEINKGIAVIGAILLSTVMTLAASYYYEGYLGTKLVILVLASLAGAFYVIFNGRKVWAKKAFLAISLTVTFISGMFINPISSGVDVIYQQEIISEIQNIAENDEGLWIFDSGNVTGMPLINMPIMAGAPTINSTNVYPDLERWELLDPDRSDIEIYNRYAHISMNLVDHNSETLFELTSPDCFTVKLNVEQLELLSVKYVLTTRKLEELATDQVWFTELSSANGYYIYQVKYSDGDGKS